MADRYWVGGTANWDGTAGTKWSATSGGAGGASVPTSADNVFFDANSGAGTVTVTATANCADLNFTGFTGTFAGSAVLVQFSGSFTAAAGMTWTFSGSLFSDNTVAGKTFTTNGKTLACEVGVSGAGSLALQDALTTTNTFTLTTSGTLTTNNHNINCKRFVLGYGTFAAGSSTITVDGNSSFDVGQILLVGSIFNPLTVTGTSTIKVQNIGPLAVIFYASTTLYNLEVYGASATIDTGSSGGGAQTFNNFKIAPTLTSSNLILYYNITVNGTFTCTGTSVQDRNFVYSNLRGTQRAIAAAAISIQDTDFRDINANGAAVPWALAGQRVGDLGNNSDITFPSAVNRYAVATGNWSNTAVWSATSGGATGASVPLPQDIAIFDANTGAGTYTFNTPRIGGVNASALGARVISLGTSIQVYKSFSLSAACTFTPGANSVTFAGEGVNTITSNTKQFNSVTVFGNYKLLSDLPCTGSMLLYGGLFEANGYNLSATAFTVAVSLVNSSYWPTLTVYMGAGTWTATGTSGWSINTSLVTLFPETSTIEIAASAASTYSFAGGGITYNNLRISGSTGASVISITGNNTFTSITSAKTNAYTLRLPASGTTTVGAWNISGSSGNIITIDSSSAGTRANLTKTGGGLIVSNFVSVKDSNASPASTFYAVNSTNAGNNVNWTFNFPSSQGNLLAFFT